MGSERRDDRGGDATTVSGSGGPAAAPAAGLHPPQLDPALHSLLAGARYLHPSRASRRGWAFAREGEVLEVHDLSGLNADQCRRAETEASLALALGSVEGAVVPLQVWRQGDWLIVASPESGVSLAQLLKDGGTWEQGATAERYAEQLARVAQTLAEMHSRGLVHRNVEPASLVSAAGADRLGLGSFAIPTLIDGSEISRYRAPEWFTGEIGPSVDQYALGVVAREIFAAPGAPPLTTPVQRTLQRATAPRPADRFPTVAEFGAELEAAVSKEAPRTLSGRIAALSPACRTAITPALLALAVNLTYATAGAPGSGETVALTYVSTLLLIPAVSLLVFLVVWAAAGIRGGRTALSLPIASHPLTPLVVSVALFLIRTGGSGLDDAAVTAFNSVVFAYGGCALLAPARPDAAGWLIRLLRTWDRRASWKPTARRLSTALLVICAVTIFSAPAIATTLGDEYQFPTVSAREFGPLLPVVNLRITLANEEYDYVCDRLMAPAVSRDGALCRDVAELARSVLLSDPLSETKIAFGMPGTFDSFLVRTVPAAEGRQVWELLTPDRRVAGSLYTVDAEGNRLIVMISRLRPSLTGEDMRSLWLYEVGWIGDEWRILEYRACDLVAPGAGKRPADCAITSDITASEVRKVHEYANEDDR